jgi:molybdopterin molybdotransferase
MTISVDEALQRVLAKVDFGGVERVPLAEARGRVLAEQVGSDVDSPPHDKSIVDGYAICHCGTHEPLGPAMYAVLEEIMAGMTPRRAVSPGNCSKIMTGAPLPEGADGVVMVERTEVLPDGRVRIDEPDFRAGQNVVRRASVMRLGEVVLKPGTPLRTMEIAILAEIGGSEVSVARRPTIAVLPTGNELVPHTERPRPAQIRNSNGPMLVSAVETAGAVPIDLGIGRDEPVPLKRAIEAGLEADILLVSGGVSMGDLDLAPGIFRELGVEEVFHTVSLKPGKPLWFGAFSHGERKTLVFGLPGNPVSSFVCFHLFVWPALRKMQGIAECAPPRQLAKLKSSFRQQGGRETFLTAHTTWGATGLEVSPIPSRGSGDLRALQKANALVRFDAGFREYEVGEVVETLPIG